MRHPSGYAIAFAFVLSSFLDALLTVSTIEAKLKNWCGRQEGYEFGQRHFQREYRHQSLAQWFAK